ncbi:hypothetical protein QWY75_06505 [Pontixanthobacter aestiaquae]|uniref:Uncharacterized protein n=1 Tax=Pontixanthobacter aestiaquae TaxID=1509367 RepID=A0A844Z6M2_9SPHN|nr:hypothetical protein [Pontixanthobacter aestiaquae]MDN3645852.1 hypothetical protein [Pontixanthobacter aestiaquae]MXO83154.1 hypothetical protein [Pontixanthobacter aestiaquae]
MEYRSLKAASLAIGLLASCGAIGLALTSAATAQDAATDQHPINEITGHYAGTFICGFGEVGMTLTINDAGPAPEDALPGQCRSGAGPCNDARAFRLASLRSIDGVLNFFPTAANPDAKAGSFKVSGLAEIANAPAYQIELKPGEWIEKPERFGASAMEATIVDGEMVGKPTAPGCYTLRLRKLSGV